MTKSRKLLLSFVGVTVAVCLSGWVAFRFTDLGRADAELDQAIADAKAAGLPWTAKDLAQQPPVKGTENAAPLIVKISKLCDGDPKVQSALTDFETAQQSGDAALLADALKRLRPVIALARQAGDKPRCDHHRDWDQSMWLLYPEFAGIRSSVRLLQAQATTEAKEGDTEAACRDLARAFGLARHAGADPILIGMLVQISGDMITLKGVERVADRWHSDAGRLQALDRVVRNLDPGPDFRRAMRGEIYCGVSYMRNFPGLKAVMAIRENETTMPGKPDEFVRDGKPTQFFGRVFLCRHLQLWTRAWKQMSDEPNPVKTARFLGAQTEIERKGGFSHKMNYIMSPVFSQAADAAVKDAATRAATRGLITVLRYRARFGRYPKTLEEAGFKEVDPYNGKPLKLIVDGDSCRVYSVGADLQDNLGTRKWDLPKGSDDSKGFDETACYPSLSNKRR